jgi:hypothetical protein
MYGGMLGKTAQKNLPHLIASNPLPQILRHPQFAYNVIEI